MFGFNRQKQSLSRKAYEKHMLSSVRPIQCSYSAPMDYLFASDLGIWAEEKEHNWGRLRS